MGTRRFLVAVATVLAGAALVATGYALDAGHGGSGESVLTTRGVVQDTDVERGVQGADAVADATVTYRPIVAYSYTVGGAGYRSESVFPDGGRSFGSRERAVEIATAYEPGDYVTVYVRGDVPSRSYLERSDDRHFHVAFAAVGLFAVAAGARGVYLELAALARRALGRGPTR